MLRYGMYSARMAAVETITSSAQRWSSHQRLCGRSLAPPPEGRVGFAGCTPCPPVLAPSGLQV